MAEWKPNGGPAQAAPNDPPAPVEPAQAPSPAPQQPEPQQLVGTDFIDFKTATPEQIEARFRRIYAHNKENERAIADLAAFNQKLEERLSGVQTGLLKEKVQDTLGSLRAQKIAALEKADYAQVAALDEQLARVTALGAISERTQAPATRPAAPAPGGLSRQEVTEVASWASQVDRAGNFLRPWALPNHPHHRETVGEIRAIAEDPRFSEAPLGEVLAEMDRRMTQRRAPAQGATVLSTGQGAQRPAGKAPQLNDQERSVAERMFMRPGYAKTREEAHAIYAKQKAL